MRNPKIWLLFAFMLVTGTCWGYGGGGGGSTSCKKPQFGQFDPPNRAEVPPGSQFSLQISYVNPDTIRVTVRQQPVEVTITPKNKRYLVTGVLPEAIKGTFARINVSASGANRCQGSTGWLVKITE